MTKPVIILNIPTLPPGEYSANEARGRAWQPQHRASRGKRGALEQVLTEINLQGWQGQALTRARVMVHFTLPTRHRRDPTSLVERVKPFLDGLVAGGVLADDDLNTIGWPVFDHSYEKGKAQTTIIVWRR